MEGNLRDIRIHDSSQMDALNRRLGGEVRKLGRKPARLPLAARADGHAPQVKPAIMKVEEPAPAENPASARQADPDIIADMVYRLMKKDLVLERERRR